MKREQKQVISKCFEYSRVTAGAFVAAAVFMVTTGQAATVYVGNNLSDPGVVGGAADSAPPLAILGEFRPIRSSGGGIPLNNFTQRDGQRRQVLRRELQFYPVPLSLVGSGPNEQTFQVVASESFSGSATTPGITTLPVVPGFSVAAGELLAFAGLGPFYAQSPNDALNSDATYEDSSNPNSFVATPPNGVVGSRLTVGINPDPSANYEYIPDVFGNQGRTYGIGVDVQVPDSGCTLVLLVPVLAVLVAMGRPRLSRA